MLPHSGHGKEPFLYKGLLFVKSSAAAIAASRGLNVLVLVIGRMVNRMIEEVDSINMKSAAEVIYEVKDGRIA